MKELDLVMTAWLESSYQQASEAEKNAFKAMLKMQDPDLYGLLLGTQPCPNQAIASVVQSIKHRSGLAQSVSLEETTKCNNTSLNNR